MKRLILLTIFLGAIAFNYKQNNKFLVSYNGIEDLLVKTNAANEDCPSSSYGVGAYLKEENCVITTTTYKFPIGWETVMTDGFKKCCTRDSGAPPNSTCYGNQETVCHSA